MTDNRKPVIVVVDDAPENLSLINDILSDDYHVKVADNGEKALRIARSEHPPDLILLDIIMPGIDGYEVCRQLKADPATSVIPVIFLTALNNLEDEKMGLELGAVDYITKPISPPIVQARIKTHLSLKLAADILRGQNTFLEQEVERRTRDIIKTEEQLRQAQKMEAMGQLAGGIAHDFNNILTIIMGYANLVSMNAGLNQTDSQHLEQIIVATERAAQLTNRLLVFSRNTEIAPALTDLNHIVLDVTKFLTRVIGEDIKFTVHQGTLKLPVNVDKTQIEQVLINLATNARDAMPRGGILRMETGAQYITPPQNNLHGCSAPGHYAWISVSDSGLGMDQQTCDRIFEPFYTTKELGKGTGLGMAIVFAAVRQHNGFISVESTPGQGTVIRVYLPLATDKETPDQPETMRAFPQSGSETILLAEDDADVRKLMASTLSRFGYEVIQAADGVEALNEFALHHNRISLIIMDIIMPRKNGIEAYTEISRIQPKVKVLYASGYPADFIKNHGVSEEYIEVLQKPIQPMELLRKVREKLDS